jgi:hypothetical protein
LLRNTSVVTRVMVESMENKDLNYPYMNKAFSHKGSRFCFICLSLFICHFCITTGLFCWMVYWNWRKSEFVSFQEDTNLISRSRFLFLESGLEGIVLHRQPLLTKLMDSSLYFLFTGFMACRCRTAAVMFKINWQEGCVGLRVGLDVVVKKEVSVPVWNRILVSYRWAHPLVLIFMLYLSYLKEQLLTSRNMQSDNHPSNIMFVS